MPGGGDHLDKPGRMADSGCVGQAAAAKTWGEWSLVQRELAQHGIPGFRADHFNRILLPSLVSGSMDENDNGIGAHFQRNGDS